MIRVKGLRRGFACGNLIKGGAEVNILNVVAAWWARNWQKQVLVGTASSLIQV